jgi:hypothetical protein
MMFNLVHKAKYAAYCRVSGQGPQTGLWKAKDEVPGEWSPNQKLFSDLPSASEVRQGLRSSLAGNYPLHRRHMRSGTVMYGAAVSRAKETN